MEGRCKFLGDLSRFESCCVAITAQNIPGCGHNHQNLALIFAAIKTCLLIIENTHQFIIELFLNMLTGPGLRIILAKCVFI